MDSNEQETSSNEPKKGLALHWKIIIGMVAGIVYSVVALFDFWGDMGIDLSGFTMDWINPFGVIFINLLKLIAVPLVLFSIIAGVSSLGDIKKIGRIGGKTLLAYLVTTVMAVTIGLTLVNLIKPGNFMDDKTRQSNRIRYEMWAAKNDIQLKDDKRLWDGTGLENFQDVTNETVAAKMETVKERKDSGPLQALVDMVPSNIFISLTDGKLMLQVIFFAIFFGVILAMIDEKKAKPVIDFVEGTNEVFLKMVDVTMKAAPFFVFALMAGTMVKLADGSLSKLLEMFKGLAAYSVVVVIGLGMMLFLIYPTIARLIARKVSYAEFFKAMAPAQLLAFTTSSSAATLPVTMECVHDNLGVNKEITSFVLPIGATVNMDGTSLYQAIAVIFLAQFHMIDLDLGTQLMIVMLATMASIGSAAVPSAGLVMLLLVLSSVGLNPAWIAIILPVDRILDMCRTVVNVTGDATVSTVIAATEGKMGDHAR